MTDAFPEELAPLKVKCTQSKCDQGLHCYRATAKMVRENVAGRCRACGISLVDWSRVHEREISDAEFTFEAMKTEFIRHHFWHKEIDEEALEHARKNGLTAIHESVPKRLAQSIGKAQPFRDGTQTPFEGKAVYYAQHATATCCRKCVQEWHAIPQGRPLTEEELAYLSKLAVLYLKERLVGIPDEGAKGPAKKTKKKGVGSPLLDAVDGHV
jgi:hypothetical protein